MSATLSSRWTVGVATTLIDSKAVALRHLAKQREEASKEFETLQRGFNPLAIEVALAGVTVVFLPGST